jgi:UDP-N-acetylglucosamine 4,6-dehydratase
VIDPNATVMITGGTGSFGHAMVTRLLADACRAVRVFSRDELKQYEMRTEFGDPRLEFHLGDVRDRGSVDRAMEGVDLVFHAAALKQVPSCEFFPLEAVATNVLGSGNVIESAIAHRVRSVVCLSTDKAVLPINAMGMSKALMEKVAQSYARQEPECVVSAVRYGNVMSSRGSVIPQFMRQVIDGQPLTVTDPEMTRFLLPLGTAIELVDFAFINAAQGDTFIRKAPAATVGVIAEAVLRIFDAKNPIKVIGVRHGEKLYETLATREEIRSAEDMGDYFRLRMDTRTLDYESYFTEGDPGWAEVEDYHSHNTTRLDLDATVGLLASLEPVQQGLATWNTRR